MSERSIEAYIVGLVLGWLTIIAFGFYGYFTGLISLPSKSGHFHDISGNGLVWGLIALIGAGVMFLYLGYLARPASKAGEASPVSRFVDRSHDRYGWSIVIAMLILVVAVSAPAMMYSPRIT